MPIRDMALHRCGAVFVFRFGLCVSFSLYRAIPVVPLQC